VKKYLVLFLCLILTINFSFSQSISSPHSNESDFSWRVLEKADVAFVSKNFSRAAKLVQIAKLNRKIESQWYVNTLQEALKPMAVQNVGDNIEIVRKILVERNSTEAVKIIDDIITLKGANYFNNSIKSIVNYYENFYIYPEAYFLEAKIYRLEGEFDLAKEFYLEAWKNSDKLDIPMEKYDILYELASLYKIQNNLSDYEKTLLLIVSDDKNFYVNGKVSDFLSSVIKNIKSGISLDKLFLLYRCDSYNSIEAYFQLAQLYLEKNMKEKFLEVSIMGMLTSVTRIEQILKERELEYTYKNFNHFYYLAIQYSDIISWGIKNKIWQGFFNFGQAMELNNFDTLAKEIYTQNVIYSPEEYWQKTSREKLKKLAEQ
jgi:tetratricopeptide (TPR) repeat protein